jgi:hypothetical protein
LYFQQLLGLDMKRMFLFLLLFCAISLVAFSQDDLQNIQFEESNVKIEKPPYFGLGGGYVGSFIFINVDDLNKVCGVIGLNNFKSPFYLSGAQGFTAIGIIPNLRIGFSGYSGYKTEEKKFDYNQTKGIKYEIGFTGFAVDYGFVVIKSLAVLPGLGFGWSSIDITNYNVTKFEWNDLTTNNYTSNQLKGSFWFVEPHVNIEFAVTPFLMLRLGAQYPIGFGQKWQVNDVVEVGSVPSSLKPNGFAINFGLFVGLFNY